MERERYSFGDVTLDVNEHRLQRNGSDVPLSPKAWDVLVHLVRRAGHLVSKQELLDTVWPSAFVEEGIVAVHVSGLRKALGERPDAIRYIETVSKSGYRFVGPLVAPTVAPRVKSIAAPEVYELVGLARGHLMSVARARLPEAARAFADAIELDPTCSAAHAGLALTFCAQAELRILPWSDAYARARVSALRALAMDDTSSDAWAALGTVMFLAEWDWIGAERSFQRALDADPRHTQARLVYGRLLDALGRLDDGLAMKLRALETDPFSPSVHVAIALSYWNQRKYDESIRWANKTLDLDPSHGLAREFLAGACWKLADFDRHMAENIKHAADHGMPAEALDTLRQVYVRGGRPGVVRYALEQAAAQSAKLPDVQLALFHGELGDLDAAIPHLQRAITGRDPCLVDLAVAPQWDALRDDPRFHSCLEEMGLAIPFSPASGHPRA
jgi:DNA-binding winged helix-turn-helix (wHTH) protein/Flp pilus assembly protein TadD